MRILRLISSFGALGLALIASQAQGAVAYLFGHGVPAASTQIDIGATGLPGYDQVLTTSPLDQSQTVGGYSASAQIIYTIYPTSKNVAPAASVHLSPSLPDGTTVARFSAEAQVIYYFSVNRTGPDAISLDPIDVNIKGAFIGGDPSHHTDAGIYVYNPNGDTMASEDLYDATVSSINGGTRAPFGLSFEATPGVAYEVRLVAEGNGCIASHPIETCYATAADYAGSDYAGVDPTITVDPAEAATGDYEIDLSANLAPPTGAVPEPGTWALLLSGLGLVGARIRRQRSRTYGLARI